MITLPSPPGRWKALRSLRAHSRRARRRDDEDRRLDERVDPEGALGVVDAREALAVVDERAAGLLVPRQQHREQQQGAPPLAARRCSLLSERQLRPMRARAPVIRCPGRPSRRGSRSARHSCWPLYGAPVRIPPVIGAIAGHDGADTLPCHRAPVTHRSRAHAGSRRSGSGRRGGGRHPLRPGRRAAGPRGSARSLRGRLVAWRRSRRRGVDQRPRPPPPRWRPTAAASTARSSGDGDGRRRRRRHAPARPCSCAAGPAVRPLRLQHAGRAAPRRRALAGRLGPDARPPALDRRTGAWARSVDPRRARADPRPRRPPARHRPRGGARRRRAQQVTDVDATARRRRRSSTSTPPRTRGRSATPARSSSSRR